MIKEKNQGLKVYTTGEVASLCGVNFRTVIRWIKAGKLKAYQLPGRGDNRILKNDLIEFLESNNMVISPRLKEKENRILIVENEFPTAKTIERILQEEHYETKIALDGLQAGSLLQLFRPNLLTLDLNMPGLSGESVIEFIRNLDDLKDIKILVISGRSKDELDEALKKGAHDILEKPFENNLLIDKIKNLLGEINEK